jgi:hypothetical protein
MQNITNTADLKIAIQLLEAEQAAKGELLKEQFFLTYESLKPANLFKSTLSEVASSPFLIDNIINTGIGLASGYLSKKIVVGASAGIFRKVIGSFLQLGVTNAVSQHPDSIKSIGQFIFQQLFRKKEHQASDKEEN